MKEEPLALADTQGVCPPEPKLSTLMWRAATLALPMPCWYIPYSSGVSGLHYINCRPSFCTTQRAGGCHLAKSSHSFSFDRKKRATSFIAFP